MGEKKKSKKDNTTWGEIRSFALGELGWTIERWGHSTIYEFNEASRGYWRNWERDTVWLMREIVFELINGNPYYKQEDKPKSTRAIFRINDDTLAEERKKEEGKTSPEELKKIEAMLFDKIKKESHGFTE
jgi:hypothetical protein